jgi:hypothetical protein
MKITYVVMVCTVASVLFGAVQCSSCSPEETSVERGDTAGKALVDASPKEGSEKLLWEVVTPGMSVSRFKFEVAGVFEKERGEFENLFQCGPLQGVWVISPAANAVVEHVSDGSLSFCQVSTLNMETSARISGVRGEFQGDRLMNVQFQFTSDSYDSLVAELSTRFGPGESRELMVSTLGGTHPGAYTLWKVNDKTWAISKGKQDTALTIQDSAALLKLPVPTVSNDDAKPAKTDLSDIGIGGSPYDVNLDDIEIPADAADTPASTDTLNSEPVEIESGQGTSEQ